MTDSTPFAVLSMVDAHAGGAGASALATAFRLLATVELEEGVAATRFDAFHLGALILASFVVPAHFQTRDPILRAASGIDHLLLVFNASGSARGLAGHASVAIQPGDILILDMARDYALAFSEGEGLMVAIPRELLAIARGDPLFHGAVFAADRPATMMAWAQLKALEAMLRRGTLRDPHDAVVATRAAAEALLEPLRHRQATLTFDRRDRSLLGSMCRYIDQHIGDPELDVAMLSSAFHVSRATVYRIFAATGGVAAYIRNTRLDQAFEQMRRAPHNRERLNVLARRFGFSSGDSFARAFKGRFGLRPVQLHGHGDEGFVDAALHRRTQTDTDMTDFDRWLFEIGARVRNERT